MPSWLGSRSRQDGAGQRRRRRNVLVIAVALCLGVGIGVPLGAHLTGKLRLRSRTVADRSTHSDRPRHSAGGATSGRLDAPGPARHSASHSATGTASPGRKSCHTTRLLVPTCGAWWGVSPDGDSLATLEHRTHRKFDLVQLWHGIDQGDIPKPKEKALATSGHLLHYNIAARRFGGGGRVSYAAIARGRFDSTLTAQARHFAGFGRRVFVTFDHEADAKTRRQSGSPRQFAAAWRHVHDTYRRAGAENVVWVWVVTGYPGNFGKLAQLYPGNRYVDWVSWEDEDTGRCTRGNRSPQFSRSFEDGLRPMVDWLKTTGAKAGIDRHKPYMITGMGTILYPGDPRASARWYRAVPRVLRKYPQVKAVQLWDNAAGRCDFRVTSHGSVTAAFAGAGHDPYVNPERP